MLSAVVSSVNGSAITKWQYQQKTGVADDGSRQAGDVDYGSWIDIADTATFMTHTVTGLTNGTSYSFRVRAVNGVGNSAASNEVSVVSGVPAEPALAAVSGDSSVVLSASVSSVNGSAITKWQYQQKAGASEYGSWVDIADTGTSITHTVTGLINGTVYGFRVRAVNSAGNSPESDEVTVTPAAVPAEPVLSAVSGDSSVVLSAVVSSANGSAITKWQYQQKTGVADDGSRQAGNSDYGSWIDIADTATFMTHTVTGLTNGTSYSFRVRAVNGVGNSAASDEVSVVSGVPAEPALSAVSGDSSVVLSASVSSVNGSAITKWQYRQKAGASEYGEWVDIADTGMSITHTVTGLINGTVYGFVVRAVNGSGNSPESDEVTVTPAAVPDEPALSAVSGDSSVVLSAVVSSANGSAITRWQYQQKAGDADYGLWTDIANTTTFVTHTVTGLTNGTAYRFRVRAVNSVGNSAASNEVSVVSGVPAEPALSAVFGDGSVVLSASVSSINGSAITKWQYRQKAGASEYGSWVDIADTGTSITHTVTRLTNGTVYGFRVRAVNGAGNSPDSDEVTVTPAAVPAEPVLSAVSGDSSVVLSASVSGVNGSAITKWQYQQKADNSDYGAWTDIADTTTSMNHIVTGLVNGTVYGFRVRAVNGVGNSAASNEVSVVSGVPAKPALDTVFGDSSVVLSAAVSSINGSAIAKWQYQQKAGASEYGSWVDIADTGTSVTHTVTGLTNGTVYGFRVRAVNGVGNSPESDEVMVTPAAVPAEPALSAVSGDGSVVLSAVVSSANGSAITKWQYQQKTANADYGAWVDIAHTTTSMNHIVTGLVNGTVYGFKVRAVNSVGNSAVSNEVSVVSGVPAEPVLSAVSGDSSAVLSASVSSVNGSVIAKWQYQQKAGASEYGEWVDVADTGTSITHTVTRLTNGTVYGFRVRAVNGAGSSPDSDEVMVTPAAVPTKPALSAVSGDGSVVLSAVVSSANGSAITKWQYRQKAGASEYGAWVDIADTGTSMTYTITGLTNGTVYGFRVRAVNGVGNSPDSNEVSVVSGVPVKPALSAVFGDGSVVLSASVSSINGSAITKWQYQQKASASEYGEWVDVADTGTSITHTVTGLTNGTVYGFRVRAVNGAGSSPDSDEVTVTPAAVPDEPVLSVVSGDGSVVLSASVSSANGSAITKWQYQQKTGVSEYGAWTDIANTGTSMTHTVTGLTNGTVYVFRVRAVNGVGDSAVSNEVSVVSGVPTKPALDAVAGDGSVVLSASVSSVNGSAITKWQYQQKTGDADYGAWVDITDTGTSITHTVTSLANGTVYVFRVRAVNGAGSSADSDAVSATPVAVPAEPTLSATPGDSSAILSALVSTDNGSDIIKWQYRQKVGASEYDAWTDIATTTTSVTHTITGLTNGTEYGFKVRAVNRVGSSSDSNEVTVTSGVPVKPALSAVSGDGSATLSAAASSDNGSDITRWQYRQKIGVSDYGSWTDISNTGTSMTHTVTRLTNGIVHAFKVRAVNSVGSSPDSNEITVTPASVPSRPSLSAAPGDGSATLSASVPTANGSDITKWQYRQKTGVSDYGPWIEITSTGTSMTHIVDSLTNGTEYGFKVRAVNGVGNSPDSNETTVTSGVPVKPSLAAVSGDSSVVLLASVSSTNGSGITKWQYQQKIGTSDYGSWADIADTGKSMTHTIASLTNGDVHAFRVRAVNSVGSSPDSDEVTVTPAAVPSRPALSAAPGDASVTLSASVSSINGSAITKWQHQQKTTTTDYGAWTDIADTATSITHTVTGLSNGTAYVFRVRAVNSAGNSPNSNESTTTSGIPAKPELTANSGDASVTLSASVSSINGSAITKWQHQQKTTTTDYGAWTDIADTATSISHTVTGLSNGTAYVFRVRAVNSVGSSPDSDEVTVTPAAVPSRPVLSVAPGDASVTLSASVSGDNGSAITKWQYRQKADTSEYGAWTDIVSTDISVTHTVTGLTNGRVYAFKVRAVNSVGSSPDSDEVIVISGVPSKPTLSVAPGDESVILLASVSSDNGSGITKWQYQHKTEISEYSTWADIADTDTSITHTITKLANDTIYTFKVRAVNSVGSSPDSNEVTVTPSLFPSTPQAPQAPPPSAQIPEPQEPSSGIPSSDIPSSSTPSPPRVYDDYFVDDDGNIHERNINAIAYNRITYGCNSQRTHYCPSYPISRAQMASFIVRALKLQAPEDDTPDPFVDTENSYHRDSIRTLAYHNITYGCNAEGTRYCPNDSISRAQMASFLARALKLRPLANPTAVTLFDIRGNTHARNIRTIAYHGITYGCNLSRTSYCPDGLVSRAQMASFLARGLDL